MRAPPARLTCASAFSQVSAKYKKAFVPSAIMKEQELEAECEDLDEEEEGEEEEGGEEEFEEYDDEDDEDEEEEGDEEDDEEDGD